MRNAFLWFVCSFSILLSPTGSAQTSVDGMTLLGMSEFSELRRPYYIAALYADTPTSDPALLLETQGRRRMEIRVSAERWSMRRFSSQWTRSIFVNNSQDALVRFDDAFVQFNSLLNRPFVRGDQIIIDTFEDGTTTVLVNGAEAMRVFKPGFTELLMTKWIGNKPPTTDFRENMLNNSSDISLEARFNELEPSASRIASLERWFAGGVAGVRIDDDEDEQEVASEVVAIISDVVEEEEVVEEVAAAEVEVAAAPAAPVVVAAVEPEPEPEPEIDQEFYQKQQEILTFLYQNSVAKRILKNVQYPSRALERDQQDRFQVKVVVDRKGNIADVSFVEESKFGLLNKAAKKAIEKTGKMPPVPPGLDGDSVSVLVPFAFILQ